MAELLVTKTPVETAARLVAGALERVQAERGFARFATSGGAAIPVLAQVRALLPVSWPRVRLTWTDERCVPAEDPDSNRGAATREARIDWPDAPAVVLPLWIDGEKRRVAETRVVEALARDFDRGLDVTLLELGADGHVAALFPAHHGLTDAGGVTFVADAPTPPARRATLTLDVLSTAALHVLVARGEECREALRRVLAGDPALPTSRLANVVVVTDLED